MYETMMGTSSGKTEKANGHSSKTSHLLEVQPAKKLVSPP